MSTEKLDLYKKLYAEYISLAVIVHNHHQVFIERVGLTSGTNVRNSLSKMMKIETELRKLSRAAYKEHVENTQEQRKKLREFRAKAKTRAMPRHYGKKKNDLS
jgi:hypothetical protein